MATKYTESELKKQTVAELRDLAEIEEIELDDKPNKATLVIRLMELQSEDDDELDDEVDDEEVDDLYNDGEEPGVDPEEDDEEADEVIDAATQKRIDAADIKAAAERDTEEDEVDEVAPKKKTRTPKAAKAAADAEKSTTLAAKMVAFELGTEAKTLRQFFRSPASTVEAVGSGGRYEFEEADLPKIKKEFDAWRSAHAARGSKRSGRDTPPKHVAEVEEVEDIEELEELDDEVDDEDLELD